jgi:hypothetical protein
MLPIGLTEGSLSIALLVCARNCGKGFRKQPTPLKKSRKMIDRCQIELLTGTLVLKGRSVSPMHP